MGSQRQNMGNILIRAHHNHAALFTVNATYLKNVPRVFVINAKDLFMVLQAQIAGARFQNFRQFLI